MVLKEHRPKNDFNWKEAFNLAYVPTTTVEPISIALWLYAVALVEDVRKSFTLRYQLRLSNFGGI